MRADALIELENVSKQYGDERVLTSIDLRVDRGELVVFVGRSGSGKSTLLRLIGSLESPTSGSIRHGGLDIATMADQELAIFRRRSLGFVFQFFNLIPTLTAAENVELPLALLGRDRRSARNAVAILLDELGVEDCAKRFPDELSGGEQQRVAIARALIHEPDLVVADEPTGNLDLDTASSVLALLEESCRARDTTLIMATHSPEVIGVADRVLTISDGRIEPLRT